MKMMLTIIAMMSFLCVAQKFQEKSYLRELLQLKYSRQRMVFFSVCVAEHYVECFYKIAS